ncbi:unnamed protein product, partial [Ectocarpus sp. 4 AP-2014]
MIALPSVLPGAGAPNDETIGFPQSRSRQIRFRGKNRIFQDCTF